MKRSWTKRAKKETYHSIRDIEGPVGIHSLSIASPRHKRIAKVELWSGLTAFVFINLLF